MAIPINALAYGAVVVAGVILLSVGTLMNAERAGRMALAAPASAAEAGQAAPAPSVATGGGTTLHSVSIDLPDSDRTFPGGTEADAINNNCLACHSAGMVLTQPTLSRAVWQAEVEKMRNFYKAPVAAEDVPAIVDYLTTLSNGK
jgi:hypothetical protein